MQRRTFAKSIASLLVVPLLNYQPEVIDRHKLLSMFLDDIHYEGRRWDFRRPYVVGEHSYATEGRVMARITTSESEHDDETIKIPPVEKAWDLWHSEQTEFKPFRLAEINELQPSIHHWGICPKCFDRRVSFGPNYPDPTTPQELLLDYDPDDNTIRDASCDLCHGHEYTEHCYQQIGNSLISYEYANKLAAIPGCEVANGLVCHDLRLHSKVPCTLFRSEVGISGIVMPIIQN